MMKGLKPIRNINAIRAWVAFMRPEVSAAIEQFIADATKGNKPAGQIVLFLMMGFAAGRAYQEANPEAPADPEGYGG